MKIKCAWILALGAAVILCSCKTMDLFSKKEEPEEPLVYYAAEEGLKLYSEPSFSSKPIAELPLHEKVLRYRNEKAFGYVKVERTGQKGWVENARLQWRIEKPEIESKTTSPQEKQEEPSDQTAIEPQQDKARAVDVLSPKEAEAATPPAESTPSKIKKKPDASVLDSW